MRFFSRLNKPGLFGAHAGFARARRGAPAGRTALSCCFPWACSGRLGPPRRRRGRRKQERRYRIRVSFGPEQSMEAIDGRLLVMLSTDAEGEPRDQISDGPKTQQIFGVDVNGLRPGQDAVIDAAATGFPLESLRQVPPGQVPDPGTIAQVRDVPPRRRAGRQAPHGPRRGATVEQGARQSLQYPAEITIEAGPESKATIEVRLDKVIPPIPDPPTTKYIKHERIESERLTKFWGRPMHLGAHILLPEGFDSHPEARYPLVIFHGHFPQTFGGFREDHPRRTSSPILTNGSTWPAIIEWSRNRPPVLQGMDRPELSPHGHHRDPACQPFYDDSYAVNSANLGPYGDAITYELIPYLEKKYRCIGAGWARFLYGGSTGGWEALAAQMFYPTEYNGCYAACPDPIDFRAYTVVDIYKDKNAYYDIGPWHKIKRPGSRNYLGHISSTLEDTNRRELVLGTKSRSGQQWDIWEAVYSPAGPDGYPKPIWDKPHRRDRPRGGRVLARSLRPSLHPRARLAQDRQAARGKNQYLCRRYG